MLGASEGKCRIEITTTAYRTADRPHEATYNTTTGMIHMIGCWGGAGEGCVRGATLGEVRHACSVMILVRTYSSAAARSSYFGRLIRLRTYAWCFAGRSTYLSPDPNFGASCSTATKTMTSWVLAPIRDSFVNTVPGSYCSVSVQQCEYNQW